MPFRVLPDNMEDDVCVIGVAIVVMVAPILRPQMDFDRTALLAAIDKDRCIVEIRPRLDIPDAGVNDLQLPAVGGCQRGADKLFIPNYLQQFFLEIRFFLIEN